MRKTSELIDLIPTQGFAVVACIAMFIWMSGYQKRTDERIDGINKVVTDALNNNTQALTKLTERMGFSEKE